MGTAARLHRFEYLFFYDKEHGFQDYRTLRPGKDRRRVDPVEQGVGVFLERAYMRVLLVNRTRPGKVPYELRLRYDRGANTGNRSRGNGREVDREMGA
jgi:hypothetical protein